MCNVSVLTHHKCGSTWTGWVLQTVLEEAGRPLERTHRGAATPEGKAPVCFLQNASYGVVRDHLAAKNFHVIRNPLSVALSAYHSHLKTHPVELWERLQRHRATLESCNVEQGCLLTIAFLESPEFYPATPGPLCALKAWDYDDDRIETLRMEDIVKTPADFAARILDAAGVSGAGVREMDRFLFERFTGRKAGEVDDRSHYRSGDPEAWRRELPPLAVAYIRDEFHEFLARFYPESLHGKLAS